MPWWRGPDAWKLTVLPPFLILGWALLLVYGISARKREWVVAGLTDLALLVLAFELAGRDGAWEGIGVLVFFVAWLGGIAYCLAARREFRDRMDVLERVRWRFR